MTPGDQQLAHRGVAMGDAQQQQLLQQQQPQQQPQQQQRGQQRRRRPRQRSGQAGRLPAAQATQPNTGNGVSPGEGETSPSAAYAVLGAGAPGVAGELAPVAVQPDGVQLPLSTIPPGGTGTGAGGSGGALNGRRVNGGHAVSETIGNAGEPGDILLKVQHHDEMVRLRLPLSQADLASVSERVSASIGCSVCSLRLRYKDDDGDWIRLDTAHDFDELVAAMREARIQQGNPDQQLTMKLQVVSV